MVETHFTSTEWQSIPDRGYARGTAFIDKRKVSGDQLLELFSAETTEAVAWLTAVASTNGFFAIVALVNGCVVLVVDRVRSIPLFYGWRDGRLCISDDASWVGGKVSGCEIDEVSVAEMLASGLVTRSHTLLTGVEQVQAGEMIIFKRVNHGWDKRSYQFCSFRLGQGLDSDGSILRERFHGVVDRAMERLVEFAGGERIAIPLSGGYDSRLIINKLKEYGYDDVVAYTYGVTQSSDVLRAKRLAEKLGVRLIYINYNEADWRDSWNNEERIAYQLGGYGWASMPHFQDWLALKKLREKHKDELAPETVIVPGHGSMEVLMNLKGMPTSGDIEVLERWVWSRRYHLSPLGKGFEEVVRRRVRDYLEHLLADSEGSVRGAYAMLEWRERQSKYLANSVRMYEYYGWRWWMPLWDNELMEFWSGVPSSVVKDKEWYKYAIDEAYPNEESAILRARDNLGAVQIRTYIRKSFAGRIMRKVGHGIFTSVGSKAFTGLFDSEAYSQLRREGYTLLGIAALQYLAELGEVHGGVKKALQNSGYVGPDFKSLLMHKKSST